MPKKSDKLLKAMEAVDDAEQAEEPGELLKAMEAVDEGVEGELRQALIDEAREESLHGSVDNLKAPY